MKRNKYQIIITAIVLIAVSGFQIIEDPIQKLKGLLHEYSAAYPEEKVYLQFDKPFYKPGEDIWFNAFVLNSNSHKPSAISDVVYVELLDPKGNVASRLELVVKEGTAHGDFSLHETAPGGLYRVHAYTNWMKNFGKENFFKKEIQVQRIITPRLLLKLDYEKESYGPGDEVKAKLTVTNLKNEKVNGATVNYSISIAGQKMSNARINTDGKGIANITFQLPGNLNTSDGLLQAIISSQGVEESISRSIPIVLNKITIQFFPEGGHWIENTEARIAFKAVNEFGKGADVTGAIVDENNMIITEFKSFHMGMGAFELEAVKGKKYFARINTPVGNESLTPLPPPLMDGFTFNLKEKKTQITEWTIQTPSANQCYLIGQAHGEIFYTEKISLAKGKNVVKVPSEKFPSGIAVFTLFNEQGLEQCERLVFLNHEKGLNIKLTTSKEKYLPREKVELKIQTTDFSGKPIPAKLSLAVADDQLISFADDKQDNILSSLLLSSEVKGEIQEPSFYFDPEEPKAAQALDYLLMTQGWRRFTWKEIEKSNKVITHAPEKVKNISGTIVNNHGVGLSSEVTLLELANKRRIESVQTTKDGHFTFKNIDPTIPILLLTKKTGEIKIQKEKTFAISFSEKRAPAVATPVSEVVAEVTTDKKGQEINQNMQQPKDDDKGAPVAGLNIALGADVQQLSEVVVTGFGVENKKGLAGSVVTIRENMVESMLPSPAIENVIQGRVAGIMIQPQSGNTGSPSNIIIRGSSSFMNGRSEPLYVIDGHPIGTSLNQNFSNGSMVGPEDIQSIEVIQSPEVTALFGSAAANGALLITTRSGLQYTNFYSKSKPLKYSSITLNPRQFSATREFYTAPPSSTKTDKREDFRSTVYWNHTLVTNDNGEAKVSFYNNDAVSAFRITAEGFSSSGLIGRSENVYSTQLPFSLDAKLPESLGYEDILRLPVRVKNETSSTLSGKLILTIPQELSVKESLTSAIEVKAQSSETFWFTITPRGIEGNFPITIKLEAPSYKDEIKHEINVQPAGFPVKMSFSSKTLDNTMSFEIDDAEQGSVKAELVAFPDVLTDLFTGAESILREPYGCFEQTSSSTFPNILALQFMKQSGQVNAEIEKKALGFIERGYKRLISYEVKGGGFEWFGKPAAHEALTAYGLLEFIEMKKVYQAVEQSLIDRTRDWLLSRRNGDGTFKLQTRGFDDFSRPSGNISNAYITYALSETGMKDLDREYQYNLSEAWKTKDMYQLALMANASYNLGRMKDYELLVQYFEKQVSPAGMDNLMASQSIVRSQGRSLTNETVALWTIALMKPEKVKLDKISQCIEFLLSRRSFGMFGSTQATILSLKTLTEYARLARTTRNDGRINVFVNNTLSDKLSYKSDVRDKLTLNHFNKDLKNGKQQLRVLFEGTPEPLPYSVNIQWHTKKPRRSEECKVSLTTSLNASSVRTNETVRLTAVVKNKTTEGLPMTMVILGLPAGLSAQPWQLKELQEKGVFDFYEIMGNKLFIYYRQMAANGINTIHLDLKAEIPGTYTGSASSAYLYYTDEYKDWAKGNSIVID